MRLVVWYPLRWFVLLLPVGWAISTLGYLGDIHHAVSKGGRKRLAQNIALINGNGPDPQPATLKFFRNYYTDRLMIFIFPNFHAKEVEKFIEIKGLEHLDFALAKGRGAILVHGHIGPVHLPLVALARIGYKMRQVGYPSDEGLSWIGRNVAFRQRIRYENMMPADVVNAESFLRPVFAWLKDNGVIMITGDGAGTNKVIGKSVTIPLCEKPYKFPLGPATLSGKTGAPLLPLFITPGKERLYRIIIEPPITDGAVEKISIPGVTEKFVKRLETRIEQNPAWWHFLDRFDKLTGKV